MEVEVGVVHVLGPDDEEGHFDFWWRRTMRIAFFRDFGGEGRRGGKDEPCVAMKW